MCAVVTCVQVINFVHVVVFVCVVIFVRVILLCDVQVYKACMDTYYQSDTSNDSIQVAHVLHSPPPPPREQLCTRSCCNKNTHPV